MNNDFIIEGNVLIKYVGNDEVVVIPDSITKIGYWAFAGCKNLKTINILIYILSLETIEI